MFTYARKSFPADQKFLVVHQTGKGAMTIAIYGCPDRETAEQNAVKRTARAKEMGLKCSYVVQDRDDGTPM